MTETIRPEDTGVYYAQKIEDAQARLTAAEQHRTMLRNAILNGDDSVTPEDLADADRAIEHAGLVLEGARRAQAAWLERCQVEAWERFRDGDLALSQSDPSPDVEAALERAKAAAVERIAAIEADIELALAPARAHAAAVSVVNSYCAGGSYVDPAYSHVVSGARELDTTELVARFVADILPAHWAELAAKRNPQQRVIRMIAG